MRGVFLGATLCLCACGEPSQTNILDGGVVTFDLSADPKPMVDAAVPPGADLKPPPCTVVAPTECPTPMPTFADVQPIIMNHCYECHDGKGVEWPLTDYKHVSDWAQGIHDDLLLCAMPPPASGMYVPAAESELILAWLRCGLPQ